MHQETWVHRHLQACKFVFDPGWRRHRRQWCVHQLFAGHFQDNRAYQKWRVKRAVLFRRRRRRSRENLSIKDDSKLLMQQVENTMAEGADTLGKAFVKTIPHSRPSGVSTLEYY